MHLYCQCGYPVLVTIGRHGTEYTLVLRDGQRSKANSPISHCPHCGCGLVLEKLEQHPPTPLRWHPRPDSQPKAQLTGPDLPRLVYQLRVASRRRSER